MQPLLTPVSRRQLVVVDHFLANASDMRAFALRQEYQHNKEYHKGQRSKTRFLWPHLLERFEQLCGVRFAPDKSYGCFQFCVAGDQLVYHSDQQEYAAVLYLTPDAPPETGTTLYRSKATKGRTIEESVALRSGLRHQQAEQLMYANKLLDATAWETVDVIGNVYNRLVLWNAQLVHAASGYFGHSKETGRLFYIAFLTEKR